ncbi:MAG: Holliday junction branch migration DNA helicase RuvB [Spirochaetota bacterium]|nr:Holliday junction branch migration DNA helicase RuvB [Spirochaetota bacterium]
MKKKERIVSSESISQEEINDYALRPRFLDQFIGQKKLKDNLKVFIEAAKKRNESLDHLLLHGPPGLGKTTLAHIIANEIGSNIKTVQAPILEKTGDIAAHLTSLNDKDVFFIDEIHRLKVAIEELLYSAMEDFKLDIVIGQGAGAKCVKIPLPRFTLIGATTKAGLLTSPFYARFGITDRLDFYDDKLLKEVVLRSAKLMKIKIDDESAFEIARRSRGTPRVVNRIMRRIRDFAEVEGNGEININIAKSSLTKLDIDENGLDMMDRRLLNVIIEKYQGGPVGLETLAVTIGETTDTIEDVYEPFLIQKGFLVRTPRGRMVTPFCYQYFGIKEKESFLF